MAENEVNVREQIVDGLMEAITNVVKTSIRIIDLTSRMYISQGRFEDLISLHRDIQKVLLDHKDEYELDKAIDE